MTQSRLFSAIDLLGVYRQGCFPMSDGAHAKEVYLICPERRGIIPLDKFHISRSLRKFLKRHPFRVTMDKAFDAIIEGCSDSRADTWINDDIMRWYKELHFLGHAHSVECWNEEGELVGGLYGLAIGGAFFGESMYSRNSGVSKVALVHLVEHLKARGFTLLDCQFVNPYLMQFGCIEISREAYQSMLDSAVSLPVSFVGKASVSESVLG